MTPNKADQQVVGDSSREDNMTDSTPRERVARIIHPVAWRWHDDLLANPPKDEDDPRLFDGWDDTIRATLATADAILALPELGEVERLRDGLEVWKVQSKGWEAQCDSLSAKLSDAEAEVERLKGLLDDSAGERDAIAEQLSDAEKALSDAEKALAEAYSLRRHLAETQGEVDRLKVEVEEEHCRYVDAVEVEIQVNSALAEAKKVLEDIERISELVEHVFKERRLAGKVRVIATLNRAREVLHQLKGEG